MGGPLPGPPFVTPEIVSRAERPFRTSPEMMPNASPPRPPFAGASPPRPPCIVETKFEDRLGDAKTCAIPAAAPPPRPVAPGAPPNRLKSVAARVCVRHADQEESARVPTAAPVPPRRPAGSPYTAVATDDGPDGVRVQLAGAGRCRHLDADGRPCIPAAASRRRRRGAPSGASGSAGEARDHVPLNQSVRRACDNNPRGDAAVSTPTACSARVHLTVSTPSPDHGVDRIR